MKTKNTLFNERMVNINVTMPQFLLDQVEELMLEFANDGVVLNRAAMLRYILQKYFEQRSREEQNNG